MCEILKNLFIWLPNNLDKILLVILVALQCYIMWRQARILAQQTEILKNQEERNKPDLGYFVKEAKIFHEEDKPTQLFLHLTLVIYNKSLASNSTQSIKIKFTRIPSVPPVTKTFLKEMPPGGIKLVTNELLVLSDISYFDVQRKTLEELKHATGQMELEITDINDKLYSYPVPNGRIAFDSNGNLRRYFENREVQG